MHRMRGLGLIALALLLAPPARASGLRLTFLGTLAGVRILTTSADLTSDAAGYLVHAKIAMAGGATLLVRGHSDVTSQGTWQGTAAVPTHLDSESLWNGKPGRLIVDFPGGVPRVLLLEPPDKHKLKALDRSVTAGSIDGLGLIAAIIHQMAQGGGCVVHARLFDGHGVTAFDMLPSAKTTAAQLPRCDFTTRKVAGPLPDENPRRVNHGYVLFAAPAPGLPPLPEKIVFQAGLIGNAALTLVSAQPTP